MAYQRLSVSFLCYFLSPTDNGIAAFQKVEPTSRCFIHHYTMLILHGTKNYCALCHKSLAAPEKHLTLIAQLDM
jgi:hypothetical protein